jgi:hypothetical protein
MKYNKIFPLVLLFALVSCGGGGSSDESSSKSDSGGSDSEQTLQTVTYSVSNDTFTNPERGFYTEIESNVTDPVSEDELRDLLKDGKTLVQILYYLNDYKDKALPDEGLTKIRQDMATVRKVGLKVIMRFAYTNSSTGSDAPMDIMLLHLDQLRTVFEEDKDVIACVQAGFIGAWGEWYYSSNNLNNAESYRKLLDKWLDVLPSDRCVQVRTPKYKQDYLGSTAAITESQAYDGTPISRIAHHNDAFMADESNMGTYQDVAKDKDYLSEEGLYLPIGGETCRTSSTAEPCSGDSALQDLRSLRWSFLNDAYDTVVLNKWEKDGVMTEIKNKLGYRIQLISGSYSTKHIPGSSLTASIKLTNVGFSAMYNPRKLQLVLISSDDSSKWIASLPEDPRTWKPLQTVTLNETVALPTDIPAGKYNLYLFLPDVEASLADNPLYAVRLANNNTWESTTGYNNLGVQITIDSNGELPASTSAIKFIKQ